MYKPLTDEQKAKIQQKEATTPDALKRDPLTDYREGWFFVTLNTRGAAPILSAVRGTVGATGADAPHCEYTPLGQRVREVWLRCAAIYPGCEVLDCEVMPEHFHGLLYLRPGNGIHLGRIIKGFMIGCTHAYWETLGIDRSTMPYTKGVRTPQYEDRDHTRSYRGPALFVRGYNDVEPLTEEQVQIKIAYIRHQAEKRLIQGDKHRCFVKCRHRHSPNWTSERIARTLAADRCFRYPDSLERALRHVEERLSCDEQGPALDYLGCHALLGIGPMPNGSPARKLPLVCHRADEARSDEQRAAVLDAARGGAVIVGAFISPKEREILHQLLQEQLPIVQIMDNGFADRYKPAGQAFYACGENRLLQISCWSYVYQRDDVPISRELCLVMNELARVISGCADDWWKHHPSSLIPHPSSL